MMEISKEKVNEYIQATEGKQSYRVDDFRKTKKLTVEEFIYIADHLNELRKGENNDS